MRTFANAAKEPNARTHEVCDVHNQRAHIYKTSLNLCLSKNFTPSSKPPICLPRE